MFCQNCGKELDKNEKRCTECGYYTTTETTENKPVCILTLMLSFVFVIIPIILIICNKKNASEYDKKILNYALIITIIKIIFAVLSFLMFLGIFFMERSFFI